MRLVLGLEGSDAQKDGDVDNYAKTILDHLRDPLVGVLVDDSQVEELHVLRRKVGPGAAAVAINLEWSDASEQGGRT